MLWPFWNDILKASRDAERKRPRNLAASVAAAESPRLQDATELPPKNNSTEATYTVSRDELGRATWTLLHSIASYYPDTPSRQQQKDVKSFVDCLSRLYPCEICAKHFQEIVKCDLCVFESEAMGCVRNNPPRCGSSAELQQWTCDVHNTVNRSLKKPTFNCDFLQARWGAVDCGTNGSCRVHFKDAQRSFKSAR